VGSQDLIALIFYLESHPTYASKSLHIFLSHIIIGSTEGSARAAQRSAAALYGAMHPMFTKDHNSVVALESWKPLGPMVIELIDQWLMHPDDSRLRSWPTATIDMALGACVHALQFISEHVKIRTAHIVDRTLMLWKHLRSNPRLWKIRQETTAMDWPLAMDHVVGRYAMSLNGKFDGVDGQITPVVRAIVLREPSGIWADTALAHARQNLARDVDGVPSFEAAITAGTSVMLLHQFFGYERVHSGMPWMKSISLVMRVLSKMIEIPVNDALVGVATGCIQHLGFAVRAVNGDIWVYCALEQNFLILLARFAKWSRWNPIRNSNIKEVALETVEGVILPQLVHPPILRLVATSIKRIRRSPSYLSAMRALLGAVMTTLELTVDEWEPLTRGIKEYASQYLTCSNSQVREVNW
jgi:hypothetical protein